MVKKVVMNIVQRLKADEGVRKTGYYDSLGYMTVGVGFCIDDRVQGAGLRDDEIEYILQNRVNEIAEELSKTRFFPVLDEVRQNALINMAYNLGIDGLLSFRKMINALVKKDWGNAACEAENSLWATQIQQSRVDFVKHCFLKGRYPL